MTILQKFFFRLKNNNIKVTFLSVHKPIRPHVTLTIALTHSGFVRKTSHKKVGPYHEASIRNWLSVSCEPITLVGRTFRVVQIIRAQPPTLTDRVSGACHHRDMASVGWGRVHYCSFPSVTNHIPQCIANTFTMPH